MTIERNVTSSRMKASESTKANTSGRRETMTSLKSFEPAVKPVTATSAPGRRPTVAGTTSRRSTSSERSEAGSVPSPLIASDTVATVLSGLISTLLGSISSPVAIASRRRSAMAPRTAGVVTSSALTTVTAGTGPPGNAAWILS